MVIFFNIIHIFNFIFITRVNFENLLQSHSTNQKGQNFDDIANHTTDAIWRLFKTLNMYERIFIPLANNIQQTNVLLLPAAFATFPTYQSTLRRRS